MYTSDPGFDDEYRSVLNQCQELHAVQADSAAFADVLPQKVHELPEGTEIKASSKGLATHPAKATVPSHHSHRPPIRIKAKMLALKVINPDAESASS